MINKTELSFIVLVSIFILIFITVLPTLIPVKAVLAIKLLVIAFLFIFFKHGELSDRAKLVALLYIILVLYGLLVGILNQRFDASMFPALKLAVRIAGFIAIMGILAMGKYSDRVIRFPIWLGTIFSVQVIILAILVALGRAPEWTYMGIYSIDFTRSLGILGGMIGSHSIGIFNISRFQSIFSEPANLAGFLLYPILISFGYYRISGRRKHLFSLIACLIAFALTFSITGFISLLLTFFVFIILKRSNIWIKSAAFTVAMLVIFSTHMFFQRTYEPDYAQRGIIKHIAFSKYEYDRMTSPDITRMYGGRAHSAIECFKIFLEHPFGVGLMNVSDIDILYQDGQEEFMAIHLYSALLLWLVKTGFVGMFIFAWIFYLIVGKMRDFWDNKMDIRYYIALAFIAHLIFHLMSATWIGPLFLFIMALILVYKPLKPTAV